MTRSNISSLLPNLLRVKYRFKFFFLISISIPLLHFCQRLELYTIRILDTFLFQRKIFKRTRGCGKVSVSKLMADLRNGGPEVKLMDRATIRLQKGDPGRLNGIQIFLQMSDVEKFPLRYSLCRGYPPTPFPRDIDIRVSRIFSKIGIRATNLFRFPSRRWERCKVNRYRRDDKKERKKERKENRGEKKSSWFSFEWRAIGLDKGQRNKSWAVRNLFFYFNVYLF